MSRAASDDEVRSSVFATTDGDKITGLLREQYVDNDIRFSATASDPRFSFRTTETPQLSADHLRSSIDYGGTCDPFDYYLFYICQHGKMRLDSAAGEQRLSPGDPTFFPPGQPMDFDFRDLGLYTLKLPPGRFEKLAAALTDIPTAQIRLDGLEPVSDHARHHWNATFDFISTALTSRRAEPPSPMMTAQMAQLLVATALETFPNSTMDRHHTAGPGRVDPAALRRAVSYIDDHAERALTLADIADAAGTTGRAIQYAFRKHRSTTPLGYLRRVRLARAHQDLQNADASRGATVSQIAARWGYANPDRFAAAYRDVYGQPPSRTLRS